MQQQIDTTLALLSGMLSAAIGFAFDVPAPTVFAAFAGACFGVALSESVSYLRGAKLIIGCTIATGFLTPLVAQYAGNLPQRGVAAIVAFLLIRYRTEILAAIRQGVVRKGKE